LPTFHFPMHPIPTGSYCISSFLLSILLPIDLACSVNAVAC
jgi:hypothetical protein